MYEIENASLFDLSKTIASTSFLRNRYAHEVISQIRDVIVELGKELGDDYNQIGSGMWVHKTAQVPYNITLLPPFIVCEGVKLRQGAFIRGNAIIGKDVVVGNSTEIKNSILFDGVQVPHYNYIGDSILGYCVHMGAGSILSNVRSDKKNIILRSKSQEVPTNLRKLGAIIGDCCEIGCGSILNPGTVLGKNSIVSPLADVRGVMGEGVVVKRSGEIVRRI